MAKDFKASVLHVSELSICFAMDSKKLSSISDCFGDQITNKNTKTYTLSLEMIAKVLNMLIGLKGDNYYSKVFKRVYYKLSNSTFLVVISDQGESLEKCVNMKMCLSPFYNENTSIESKIELRIKQRMRY